MNVAEKKARLIGIWQVGIKKEFINVVIKAGVRIRIANTIKFTSLNIL